MIRQVLSLLLLAAIPTAASAFLHPELFTKRARAADEIAWAEISATRASVASGEGKTYGNFLLIDARSSSAYAQAHIPGALSLNGENWETQLPELIAALGPTPRVVIYCDDDLCGTSRDIAARLRRELALEDVRILRDGWRAWQQAQTAQKAGAAR